MSSAAAHCPAWHLYRSAALPCSGRPAPAPMQPLPPTPHRSGKKVAAQWTPALQEEVTHFYLTNYLDSFSTPEVDRAFAQIPQVGWCPPPLGLVPAGVAQGGLATAQGPRRRRPLLPAAPMLCSPLRPCSVPMLCPCSVPPRAVPMLCAACMHACSA